MSDGPPVELPAELDQDVTCLACGYNLRGLPGDPVRCPECAWEEPRGEVFGRMMGERGPLAFFDPDTPVGRARCGLRLRCRLCGAAVVPALLAAFAAVSGGQLRQSLFWPLLVTATIVGVLGFIMLTTRCRGIWGWRWDLALCMLWTGVAMVGNFVVALSLILLLGSCMVQNMSGPIDSGLQILGFGLFILVPLPIVCVDPMRWLARPGRAALDRLAQGIVNRDRKRAESKANDQPAA